MASNHVTLRQADAYKPRKSISGNVATLMLISTLKSATCDEALVLEA